MNPTRALLLTLAVAAAPLGCQRQLAGGCAPSAGEGASQERRVRAPTVAGQFYPGDAEEIRREVRKYFATAQAGAPAKMVLAPHAGWMFSGAIAAASMRQLAPGFERVLILAANHNGEARYQGVSVDRATHYQVPGLEVKVAAPAAALLSKRGFVDVPAAHTAHVVEVELPFLAEANAGKPFEIVPLIVGSISREQARQLARELAALVDEKTRIVVSVDMSHYHPYDVAVGSDKPCLDAIVRMDADDVVQCDTDGTQVLLTMVELAAHLGLTPRLVAYANSGDVPDGDRSRVVGYGAVAFEDRYALSPPEQEALLTLARRSIEAQVREGRAARVPEEVLERYPRLAATRGAFVTLKKQGQLRGCIGTLEARQALAEDVAQNAVHAAIHDQRFSKVTPEELGAVDLSISVLEPPRPLTGVAPEALPERLAGARPGLIIEYRGRRSTFLPEVWEELPEPLDFLGHLCRKQGSPEACWREQEARFETYGALHFAEPPRPQ